MLLLQSNEIFEKIRKKHSYADSFNDRMSTSLIEASHYIAKGVSNRGASL
jgi:hypothetical protein